MARDIQGPEPTRIDERFIYTQSLDADSVEAGMRSSLGRCLSCPQARTHTSQFRAS